MKTQVFRVWVLGVAITSLALGTGCQQGEARAEVPDVDKLVPELAPAPGVAPARIDIDTAEALERAGASATNVAPPKVVANPVMPENLKASPGLQEVLKLAQAGVSEEVMLAYIANSTSFFNVSSDVIVYLNDLGVANNVITSLIQHDSTPEMQARRQAAGAVQPLPPGVALTAPATNVYPPAVSQTVPPLAPDTTTAPPPPVDAEVAAVSAPEEPASVSYFYSSLAPYGTWVDVDGYGLCWQPTVVVSNPHWRPYCDRGRWMWSDCGWYWYSDYSWGWGPFHYGRWCDYPRLGWVWMPDTCWGPSWVSWRYSSAYCGWAPLPPACHYRPGFGFSYYGSSVGFSFGFDFGLSYHHYNYVPVGRVCDRSPGLHVVRPDRALAIHRGTTVINNYVVGNNNTIINNGVGRERIAAATRGSIPTATVREAPTRTSARREQIVNNGSSLAIVRPSLPERPDRSHVPVPNRAGITRVSADGQAVPPNSRLNTATRRDSASLAGTAERPALLARDTTPTRNGSAEPAAPSGESRTAPNTSNRQSPQAALNAARSPGATQRERIDSFRSYARPGQTRNETTPQVAVNSAPTPAPSTAPSVSRPQASDPSPAVATPTAPAVTRPSTPAASRPAAPTVNRPSAPAPSNPRSVPAPNSAARIDQFRNYGNPAAAARPTAPAASAPQVSRPAVSAPAPAPARSSPSPSVSRPEPSRPSQSYSAPAQAAPSRSAPSYSAPASRPSSSDSAPSRSSSGSSGGGNSGRGGGGGRGRGD